jgi:DNA-binding winged helix-turn-helix (wHTH) protein/tetratricopeptide (TPR) repeat protein
MLAANSAELRTLKKRPTSAPLFANSPWVYVFGPFRLDPARGLLTYGSEIVPLPQRLFELLHALIEANGSVVSRDALTSLIWPEGNVAENNLSQHMYMLRRALGERAGDRLYIVTAHRKGFRFVAPVSIEHPADDQTQPSEHRAPDSQLVRPGLDVFRLYSRGCRSLERGGAADLRTAVEHFDAALRIDPDYVPALVALARAHLSLSQNCYTPGEHQFPKAKNAAIRALQLDPSSAIGHGVLSNVILFCDWNWREAKREIDNAVRLNPESTMVRASGVWLYQWIGQPERAVIEAQRAVMSEPSSPALQMLLGKALIGCSDYSGALDHFSNLIETNPEYTAQARCQRAQALILSDQPARALLDLLFLPQDRAEDLALRLPLLGQAYADDGQQEKAHQVYETLLRMADTEYVAQTNLITLALSIGERNAALRHLENAVAWREPALPLLRHSPRLMPIRKSDAFKALIAAMGSA